jgi:hypothetical protein
MVSQVHIVPNGTIVKCRPRKHFYRSCEDPEILYRLKTKDSQWGSLVKIISVLKVKVR